MTSNHDYIPLATSPVSPTHDGGEAQRENEVYRSRGRFSTLSPFLTSRPKTVYSLIAAFTLLILLGLRPGSPPSPSTAVPIVAGDNPYFTTGKIWDHNDEIAARLDRCASLGLLRNTSNPLSPEEQLSQEEEDELIAQGCGTNQTTIIILSSLWASEAFSGTSTAGETIYAQSVISTLNALGYAYVFANLGWWNPDMRKTVELWKRHRNNVRLVLADPDQLEVCWKRKEQECLKTEENPDGIEAWRILSFWYWDDPGNPLGPKFTLSPSPRNDNHFLSYSIEPTCRRLPYLPQSQRSKPPQAYLLAKQIHYLDDTPAFSWTLPALIDLQREFKIKVVGGMTDDDEVTAKAVQKIGLTNLGKLGKIDFYTQLAQSSVLIGVGRPRISPSPWDALCMGVPFINPILKWDEEDPSNRTKWHAQQWHMTDLNPPYVYSVPAHDLVALRQAVHDALENPIESYIPDYMKFDYVVGRMAEVVDRDWKSVGAELLEERKKSGEGELFVL
ncbi:hypothetical protein CI109_106330 [Kwoniella shandongensis]|uniref:Glycosyltransferase family 18 catalytic domain-containing protein n=1 Tax=Kwoniella shandongensis TaxID=1734106 RepID=A0A5M6BNX7_9TREE|nr:uncharacterized protein CI109_007084 [Kwoniella shandongensis]KAA5524596.1 hypothetical protein CI109_007084 [Kwoniella shandongensis]